MPPDCSTDRSHGAVVAVVPLRLGPQQQPGAQRGRAHRAGHSDLDVGHPVCGSANRTRNRSSSRSPTAARVATAPASATSFHLLTLPPDTYVDGRPSASSNLSESTCPTAYVAPSRACSCRAPSRGRPGQSRGPAAPRRPSFRVRRSVRCCPRRGGRWTWWCCGCRRRLGSTVPAHRHVKVGHAVVAAAAPPLHHHAPDGPTSAGDQLTRLRPKDLYVECSSSRCAAGCGSACRT